MPVSEASRIGKRGTFVIPVALRRRFGLTEGSEVIAEETTEGILIRPAVTIALEMYPPQRKAELLLSNAVDEADYQEARRAVEALGLDPDAIVHARP